MPNCKKYDFDFERFKLSENLHYSIKSIVLVKRSTDLSKAYHCQICKHLPIL
ncbi:unnamed protein product [Moneuplotes crassus]|uniref:Uncharacterized protein n=1 Tax=Euplotes crassus TaxID=5936 RepID=A0AAD1XW82_EUPCR|nr:unnamed protein product [Moneuplotes crassus]